ncbi:MAG: GNAT family protein [Anaerolineae bacterium]|nr:GNAT family protein [Anaerolineae bacterium]
MQNKTPVILSNRLKLIPLPADFLQLSLDNNQAEAERMLGLSIPPDWFQEQALIKLRLEKLQNEPAFQPWCLRAIALRQEQQMAGHIGFHAQPGAEYLRQFALTGVEYGYTIYPPFRRQGYAREACKALMKWAYEEQNVTEFVVTISPDNIASRRLADGFGFEQVGSHIDEEDGLEYIYTLTYGERK